MDRLVLLVLLGAPILVIFHVALSWRPESPSGAPARTSIQDRERAGLQNNWPSPKQVAVPRFVVEPTTEQGS